jgi:23S rRNA (cytidine1920-2'-O)/16S rRNA (cytidine1409-2'-O)-methyltransferase
MRLDQALQQRGLVASRSAASRLIQAGAVSVDGKPATKASLEVFEQSSIELSPSPETEFVSRAGAKLAGVFKARPELDAKGYWVDFGQSTGGFTDCLLRQGAERVLGFDVGHEQLSPKLREDSRVCCIEACNLRNPWPAIRNIDHMEQSNMQTLRIIDRDGQSDEQMQIADLSSFDAQWPIAGAHGVVIDVSFIALSYVMPQAIQCIRPGGCCIALIKPQFELGADPVLRKRWFKNGLVRESIKLQGMLEDLVAPFKNMGLDFDVNKDVLASVLAGTSGNQEYFLLARRNRVKQAPLTAPSNKQRPMKNIPQPRSDP